MLIMLVNTKTNSELLRKLASELPLVAHCLPFGTEIQTDTHMGQAYSETYIWDRHTDRHTYGTDIQTDTHMGQTYRQTWPTENSFYARNFFVCAPILGLGFFQTPRTHGESVHVLRFKIGP